MDRAVRAGFALINHRTAFVSDGKLRVCQRCAGGFVVFSDGQPRFLYIRVGQRFRFAPFKLNIFVLGVEDVTVRRGDFLDGINDLVKVLYEDTPACVGNVFTDRNAFGFGIAVSVSATATSATFSAAILRLYFRL